MPSPSLSEEAMARKPNYRFERSEREKNKALKKAERLRAKTEKAEAKKRGDDNDAVPEAPEEPEIDSGIAG